MSKFQYKKPSQKSKQLQKFFFPLIILFLLVTLPLFVLSLNKRTSVKTHAATVSPVGPTGSWNLIFDDEFDGTALDTNKWSPMDGGRMNNAQTYASNVTVSGGMLTLTLQSANSGAYIMTHKNQGAKVGFTMPVGAYAEARINFPGNGTTIYNWPAWWVTSYEGWPAGGEHDIAEGLGTLTVNYHSNSGAHNQGTIPGNWANEFHVYGMHRQANKADVYWDGKLVKSYSTDDDGTENYLVLNVGSGYTEVYGAASQVKVDYVRVWQPVDSTTKPIVQGPSGTIEQPSAITPSFVCAGGVNCVGSPAPTYPQSPVITNNPITVAPEPKDNDNNNNENNLEPNVPEENDNNNDNNGRHTKRGFSSLLELLLDLFRKIFELFGFKFE